MNHQQFLKLKVSETKIFISRETEIQYFLTTTGLLICWLWAGHCYLRYACRQSQRTKAIAPIKYQSVIRSLVQWSITNTQLLTGDCKNDVKNVLPFHWQILDPLRPQNKQAFGYHLLPNSLHSYNNNGEDHFNIIQRNLCNRRDINP